MSSHSSKCGAKSLVRRRDPQLNRYEWQYNVEIDQPKTWYHSLVQEPAISKMLQSTENVDTQKHEHCYRQTYHKQFPEARKRTAKKRFRLDPIRRVAYSDPSAE